MKCFRRHKALHMVMVMSTAGRRGKWKASTGSFTEQSIVHYSFPFFSLHFYYLSFFNTWDDERWQILYIRPFVFTSFLFDCGLASRENEPPFFNLREISIFIAVSYYFFSLSQLCSAYLLLTGLCHTLGFPSMSLVPHSCLFFFLLFTLLAWRG